MGVCVCVCARDGQGPTASSARTPNSGRAGRKNCWGRLPPPPPSSRRLTPRCLSPSGYLGVCASSLVAIRAIAFASGPVGLGQVVVGALALFSLGTALVQLKKIHQFNPSSSSL